MNLYCASRDVDASDETDIPVQGFSSYHGVAAGGPTAPGRQEHDQHVKSLNAFLRIVRRHPAKFQRLFESQQDEEAIYTLVPAEF